MNLVRGYGDSERDRQQIADIVGCRMVGGACVTHQSREWEARRPGCPYLDSLMGYARSRVPSAVAAAMPKQDGTSAA